MFRQLKNNHYFASVQSFLTHHWTLLLLAILLVGGALALILRALTPSTVGTIDSLSSQGNPDGTNTTFLNLIFLGTTPKIPEKMWVAQVLEKDIPNSEDLVSALVQEYKLSPSPHVEGMWIGETHTLTFDQTTGEYRLVQRLTPPPEKRRIITPILTPRLVTIAEARVTETFPNIDFVSFPQKTSFLTGGAHFDEATMETATHISVPFGQSFYDIPVLLAFEPEFPLRVFVDSEGEVTTIIARPFTASFKESTQHFSLSAQEAIKQIELGNASIIDSFSESTFTPTLDKVVRGEFSSVTLEYRIDPTTNLLIPYYHFVGTLVNIENDIFSASVITPAVRLSE